MPQTLERLTRQARLQVEARTADHRYELSGSRSRSAVSVCCRRRPPGDMFFDIEGYPYFESYWRARVSLGRRLF